jgi:hypothetical protein
MTFTHKAGAHQQRAFKKYPASSGDHCLSILAFEN